MPVPNTKPSLLVSRLYLEAVLPTLAPLCRYDSKAATMIENETFGVRFALASGEHGSISFHDNQASSGNGTNVSQLNLLLPTAAQCVSLFSKKGLAIPIPLGGWSVLPKMGLFQKVTDRLEAVLQPDPADLEDPDFLAIHAHCSLFLAVRALVVLLELDPEGQKLLPKLPKGIAVFRYRHEKFPDQWIDLTSNTPQAGEGELPGPALVTLEFKTDQTAQLAMANRLDSLAALGKQEMVLTGYVPFADSLDLVMKRIQPYLT
ncbi:MAG: hypothetical protein AAF558_14405 [Verrucomicrobiota bacterium]